jgi:hypothetical protein
LEARRVRRDGLIWIGLARGRLATKTPFKGIGFAWIPLGSLARNETYQRLTREKQRKILCRAFPRHGRLRNGGFAMLNAELPTYQSGGLGTISDFLQDLV